MRQQFYYHPDVLKNLACAVLFDAVQVYEREQRAMVRHYKKRNIWKFKIHKSEYDRVKRFLYSDNMWYDYLDINKDYFLRMLEGKEKYDNGDLYVLNDGCIDYDAVKKWLKEEKTMTRGFLLIDASKNTIIIPWNDEELVEIIKRKGLRKVHKHKTLKELDTDVHNYLNGKYEEDK